MKKDKVPLLAENIKTLRENSGLTLEHCAKKLGLKGKTSFHSYETGQSEPSISVLIAMCHLFKTDINHIVGFKIKRENKPIFNECKQCGDLVKSESGRPISSNYCNKCYWE